MKTEHRGSLLSAITDVFEKFGFMFVETAGEPAPDGGDEYLQASITFSGPARGEISIAASPDLSRQLAANALGVPAGEANAETGQDALKELVNLICGELTVALFGEQPVFDLGVPRVDPIDGDRWRELYTDPQNVRVWADEAAVVGSLVVVGEKSEVGNRRVGPAEAGPSGHLPRARSASGRRGKSEVET